MRTLLTVLATIGLLVSASHAEPGAWISQLLSLPVPETLEFCGEPVPLEREDTLERLDLELVVTLGSPVTTTMWLKRMTRHLPFLEQEIRRRGLPDDLKYVAMIESNLRADAVSYAGAVGPWQFIRATGKHYGLDANGWQDARRDWGAATAAALAHLEDLYQRFGSWPLALAAYNCGERRVAAALERQGEGDFYGLDLPRETERYVFRALAAKLVVEDPTAYGIQLEEARQYPPDALEEVAVRVERRSLPVAAVSAAAGVSYRRLVQLNAWIVGAELPRGTYWLRVPKTAAERFGPVLARWLDANPEPATVYYRVRRGDTLSAIAQRHNVRLSDLCSWNGLSTRSIIRPGQELVVQTVD